MRGFISQDDRREGAQTAGEPDRGGDHRRTAPGQDATPSTTTNGETLDGVLESSRSFGLARSSNASIVIRVRQAVQVCENPRLKSAVPIRSGGRSRRDRQDRLSRQSGSASAASIVVASLGSVSAVPVPGSSAGSPVSFIRAGVGGATRYATSTDWGAGGQGVERLEVAGSC